MIRLTRLNGEVLYLNYLQIEYVEQIPETKVRMMNGNYYLVKDTPDMISQQIAEILSNCIAFVDKNR